MTGAIPPKGQVDLMQLLAEACAGIRWREASIKEELVGSCITKFPLVDRNLNSSCCLTAPGSEHTADLYLTQQLQHNSRETVNQLISVKTGIKSVYCSVSTW